MSVQAITHKTMQACFFIFGSCFVSVLPQRAIGSLKMIKGKASFWDAFYYKIG
jgi:hypothetical protein